jgi:hypothetical protein
MSSISAGTTTGTGLVHTSDTVGDLLVKTGASAVTSATFSGTTQGLQLANTLSVTGATTLGATTVTGNLSVSANTTTGNLTVSANTTTSNLTVSANTTTSNLSVTGSVLLTAPLPVAQGGTGATTSGAALTSLGAVTTGKSIAMALIFGF